MLPYQRNPDSRWELRLYHLAAIPRSGWGVFFLLVVVVSFAVGTLLWGALTEVFRIYRVRALRGGRSAQFLWASLAVLVIMWCGAYLITQNSGSSVWGLYLFSWSFLLFVCMVVGYDRYAAKRELPNISVDQQDIGINEVLHPWV